MLGTVTPALYGGKRPSAGSVMNEVRGSPLTRITVEPGSIPAELYPHPAPLNPRPHSCGRSVVFTFGSVGLLPSATTFDSSPSIFLVSSSDSARRVPYSFGRSSTVNEALVQVPSRSGWP